MLLFLYILPTTTLQWTNLSLPNDCIQVYVSCPKIKEQRLLMLINYELPLSSYLYYPRDCCVYKVDFFEIGHAIGLVSTSNFLFKIYLHCLLLYERVHSPAPTTT
jgi:hypothetical protein